MSEHARPRGGVVVGVDGSAPARAALEFAYRDAARRRAPLWVVAAYSPPEYTQIWLEAGAAVDEGDRDEVTARIRRVAQEMADGVRVDLSGEPAPASVQVVVAAGLPARTLIELSADADLLVVGSRGHGGFARMMLGSVSLQSVLHAQCPVTVVHSAVARQKTAEERTAAQLDPLRTASAAVGAR